jgi:Cytochrome c554 and c-prime
LHQNLLSINKFNVLSKLNCSSALRFAGLALSPLLLAGRLSGADLAQPAPQPKFLGAASCSSSGCHGGGGEHQNQFLVWSLRDFHSQRPVATLTTARSKQIADALGVKDPTEESRCTTCHAPLREVPESLRGEHFKVGEGVSCESCHGPAENWLRSHTRHDYTHADRVAAGMRDLDNLYVRANTCVACHQTVDADLLAAGHPELMFELDGQSVSEPKHWREATNWNGAQTWLVGQAVALREMSWQEQREQKPGWQEESLYPILTACANQSGGRLPTRTENLSVGQWSDLLARSAAGLNWSDDLTRQLLSALAGAGDAFRNNTVSQPIRARQADRLVLGLDRLTGALPELKENQPVQAALKQLFADAQSRPDFDPVKFATDLDKFSQALK